MNESRWTPVSRLRSPFVPSMILAIWSTVPLAAVLAGVTSFREFLAVAVPAAIFIVAGGLFLPMRPPIEIAASNWKTFAGFAILLNVGTCLILILR